MPSLNKVMLMGNLTRDPEVRYTPKGTAVADLGMAINMTFQGQDGQTKEEVVYVDVVTWGRQAETCGQYLKKGAPVFVEGRLQLDQWEDKDGQKRSKLRVRAERVQFLSRREGAEGAEPGGNGSARASRPAAPAGAGRGAPPAKPSPAGAPEDDIPF